MSVVMDTPISKIKEIYCEAELLDFWYAYLETQGVIIKSWKQEAKSNGFTESELEKYEAAMMNMYPGSQDKNSKGMKVN